MFIADLHIHSKYSRATSRDCVPEALDFWARRKGLDLIGTGDFTHPAWRAELSEKLRPAEEGLYVLKDEYRLPDALRSGDRVPRFLITGEISSIYKKNGKVRKVHNLILLSSIPDAEKLSRRLEIIGNLHSDGRPILGLDSRDLLEITLDCCPDAVFIPAHIWTPHFSLFGAYSGFDDIRECFGDLTPHIHALETGLSSDPPMNWRLSALDAYTLVSNSDAHSPAKLAREANLFQTEMSFPAISRALQNQDSGEFLGTIEFFPEEGKYHFDGHRNCNLCYSPEETVRALGVCPVCGGKITVGVLHRVEELADRKEGIIPPNARKFESLVPLPEVIGASTGSGSGGVRVQRLYESLLSELGPEMYILREAPLDDVEQCAGRCVAEGIRRLRAGKVTASPGYDGEYGKIKLLEPDEMERLSGQTSFYSGQARPGKQKTPRPKPSGRTVGARPAKTPEAPQALETNYGLNAEQWEAASSSASCTAVTAGPGTGKTRTLVFRIAYLMECLNVPARHITAVTFTNKAAREIRSRVERHFKSKKVTKALTVGTFHSICLQILQDSGNGRPVIDEFDALSLAEDVLRNLSLKGSPRKFLQWVSGRKTGILPPDHPEFPDEAFAAYCQSLRENLVMDFDDLLLEVLRLSEDQPENFPPFPYLLVDEFQDVSPIQYRLIRAWTRQDSRLFVIGDPDQAIYGFRGSDPHCFERLLEDYSGASRIRLFQNYRSTPEILQCAGSLFPGTLSPNRENGSKVRLLNAPDPFSEALYVVKEIGRLVGGIDMLETDGSRTKAPKSRQKVSGFSEIAVLYRTHRQAELLEKCLSIEGIPYVVTGRDDFLSEPDVRRILAFFRLLLNPDDSFSRRSAQRLFPDGPSFQEALSRIGSQISVDPPAVLLDSLRNGLTIPDSPAFERLANTAVMYHSIRELLQNLTLGRESDVNRCGNRVYSPDAVSLMTLHGSKGLEFPVVFLCGVREGMIPLKNAVQEGSLEEERRLFYVGLTRAQDDLFLMTSPEPSEFLSVLPEDSLDIGSTADGKRAPVMKQLSLF